MQSKKTTFLRGRVVRATRLDVAGRPVYGEDSVATSKGVITIGYTTVVEEGEAINVPNFAGETCVSEPGSPTHGGFGVEIEFCEVDFGLFTLLTGQDVVIDPVSGKAVGITESVDVDLSTVNIALELWLGAQSSDPATAGGDGYFGYVVTPFLQGGVISDVTVENSNITFTIGNMSTKSGHAWGAGPYAVELGASGPTTLSDPLGPKDHRRIQLVEVAPPAPQVGLMPLLDPTDAAVTALTATATGLSVDITPTPAGTDPMWYDLGDGTWDYAATGSYTHVYDAAGTYTIVGHRGASEASTTVTVTAP